MLLPVFGLLLWWQARRRQGAEQEAETLAEQARVLRATLESSRDGYVLWLDPAGETTCSRRLSVMLDLTNGTASTLADVLDSITPETRPPLAHAIDRLRGEGQPFTLEALHAGGRRRLAVRGLRVPGVDEERCSADVLWVQDLTDGGALSDADRDAAAQRQAAFARLEATLDALPTPVWVRDDDLNVTLCNEAYARAVEAPDRAAAVRQGRDLAGGDLGRELRALAARCRAAGTPLTDRFHLAIDGTRRLMEITEAPFTVDLASEAVRLTAGTARDISALEEIENRLAREQANQAVVLEHLSTAIAIFGPATRLSYHNPAFARLWRLDSTWLRETQPPYGDLLDMLRDRRTLPEVADYPAFKAAEVGRFTSLIEPMEDLVHLPDGKTLRRVIAPQPIGGLLVTYEDVTDKLSLERSYNTLTAVQRETLDHLHEAVGVFGADGRLKLANPAFAALWGETAASVEAPPQLAEFLDLLRDHFTDESSWRHHRFAVLTPPSLRTPHRGRVSLVDGPVLDYACVPLPDGGILLSYNDVSDTARVEQALRERAQTLSAASMLRADFIASLSYELRTPLTTIAGFSEMLCAEYHGNLNAQQIDYSQSIAETARDLVSILDDIADLVTIEAGRAALDVDVFDVHAAVSAVLALCREATRRRAVALELNCPPEIGWMVGDEARIKQILFHMTGNAIKISPAGSRVRIGVTRDRAPSGAETVTLSVADEAGDAAGRSLSTGRGLMKGGSLAMLLVRRFAEMHGGSIVVSAEPGVGTTVLCRLPSGRIESLHPDGPESPENPDGPADSETDSPEAGRRGGSVDETV
ncbi:PAS-domain containing protein [Roseospira goensis]|uniref:histidine kinase n=1 Tax=Roseospira goensis TaxID=391922 RepID=A0A7W6WJM4_9PROT|nr:PAS domain-containing protein [Roseospira goensis]